eukprot:m.92178 g.92178  ORF g.92178 m.92178 type:complete len:491 (+) comp13340_c1_seq4:206-1678(+)
MALKLLFLVLATLASTNFVFCADIVGLYSTTTGCGGDLVENRYPNAAPLGCAQYFLTTQNFCKNPMANNTCCELTEQGAIGSQQLLSWPEAPTSVRIACIPTYSQECEEGREELHEIIDDLGDECPRQCEHDEDDGDEDEEDDGDDRKRFNRRLRMRRDDLRNCQPNEEQFVYDMCHNVSSCKTAVGVTKERWTAIIAKLEKCPVELTQQYQFSLYQILEVASICGFLDDSDLLDVSPCMTSTVQLSRMDKNCPKQCEQRNANDDPNRTVTENGKRYCNPGEKEYLPSMCGATCENYIASTTKSKIAFDKMIDGFNYCKDIQGFEQYAAYATYNQYLQGSLFSTAQNCGVASSFGFTLDACVEAVFGVLTQFNVKCPVQCTYNEEDTNGMRICGPEEDERTPATCGTSTCKEFLQSIDVPQLYAGLNTCEGPFAEYKRYTEVPIPQMETTLKNIGGVCGLNITLNNTQPEVVSVYSCMKKGNRPMSMCTM